MGDIGRVQVYKLISNSNISSEYSQFARMIVPGLFGGYYTSLRDNGVTHDDGRNLTWTKNSFITGDVLLLVDDDFEKDGYVVGEVNMYLYVGDKKEPKFATIKNGEVTIIQNEDATK